MEMTHALLPDFNYLASKHQVPIDIFISSNTPIEISSRVEINAALLTKVDDPQIVFGFVRRVLPAKEDVIVLEPGKPIPLKVDILERDEDFDALVPGKYRYEIKAQVKKKVGNELKSQDLKGEGFVVLR